MSAFSNPFAQVGDYQVQRSADDELVTTSYLTGLPDPRQIQDQHVGLIFRTLLKRDTRTKQRALGELEQWISSLPTDAFVEDAIHLGYLQMYAKLSIDAAPLIRVQSHVILGKLYSLLGKRSSKYLKYSVGPWVAATNDPDPRAAAAAKDALDRIFPGEKNAILMDKMKEHILSFVYDSCTTASARSLSDERYVSKEDASHKYTRLVKCCIDILARVPHMFDLDSEQVESLVSSGRLWKFYSSSDPALARSTLQLTMAHADDLEPYAELVWHELMRAGRRNSGGSGVAIEVVRLMNVFTKKYPSITWPENAAARKDIMASLAQFVAADPPHPSRFWPLLYNLVLMVPASPLRDLTPLYKPLEKAVMKIKHDSELERSAWGCFVSLANKMGPDYVQRAFKAAEQRCKLKNAIPIDVLATFLARFADVDGVRGLVKTQLEDAKVPFAYCRVIAQTQKFRSDLESVIVPRVDASQLVLLVAADPALSLPDTKLLLSSPLSVSIAAKSQSVDSQAIVDAAVTAGPDYLLAVLENAAALSNRGVRVSLDNRIPHDNDTASLPLLRAAVAAHSTFVTRDTAVRSFKLLVQRAMDDEVAAKDMFRVVRENQEFINSIISTDAEIKHDLETLKSEDKLNILGQLPAMKIQFNNHESADSSTAATNYLKSVNIGDLNLSVPLQIVSKLRASVPLTTEPIDQALAECEHIVSSVSASLENLGLSSEDIAKLCILQSYAQEWLAVALKTRSAGLESFVLAVDGRPELLQPTPEIWKSVWELVSSTNYSVAYHAAKALSAARFSGLFSVDCYSKSYFVKPSLHGALIVQHRAASSNQEYESVQRSLVRRALGHNLDKNEWMLVDDEFVPETTPFSLNSEELKDPELTSMILQTIRTVENRVKLALEPTNATVQLSALNSLTSASDLSLIAVLKAASHLPIERNNFDKERGWALLRLLNRVVAVNRASGVDVWQLAQELLTRRDSECLPWMALLISRSADQVKLNLDLDHAQQGSVTRAEIVSWLIYLNYCTSPVASHDVHVRILDYVARGLRENGDLAGHEHLHSPELLPSRDFQDDASAGNLLYQMCSQHGNDVREWYRNLRDKQTQKYMDTALATYIVPELISAIKEEVELHPPSDEAEVTVNRKQREVRASREVEDEFTVEIVISMPEQYPGKPAVIEIRNLAGVSEAKKRGWLLEARQTVQNDGVLKALNGMLVRLNNFLDGVEPCAICYSTVNDANKLPNRECGQCHNIYHSDCLYKWFTTNNNKLCPMCRSPM